MQLDADEQICMVWIKHFVSIAKELKVKFHADKYRLHNNTFSHKESLKRFSGDQIQNRGLSM